MLDRVLSQYKDDTPSDRNVNKLLNIFAQQMDALEAIFVNLRDDTNLDDATGVWLDYLGKIIGLERPFAEEPTATTFAFKPFETSPDDPNKGFENGGVGGYMVGLKGLPDVDDPSLKKTDDQYRAMLKAKIQANISDGTIIDIYNYLVTGRGLDGDLTVDSVVGRGEVTIIENDFFSQLERYLLDLVGPHSAATELHVTNWTQEHLPFDWYLSVPTGWAITSETIDGDASKALHRTAASGAYCWVRTRHYSITAPEAAYGEWTFWAKKAALSTFDFMPIAHLNLPATVTGQYGYLFKIDSAGDIYFYKITNGVPTALFFTNTTPVDGSWHEYKITRDAAGEFSVYLDDVLVVPFNGTNPITNTVETQSNYQVFNIDQNDYIGLCTLEDVRLTDFVPLSKVGKTTLIPFFENLDNSGNWFFYLRTVSGKNNYTVRVDVAAATPSAYCYLDRWYWGHSPTEAAYGEWTCRIWYDLNTVTPDDHILIIASELGKYNATNQRGYSIRIEEPGYIGISRIDNGVATRLFRSAINYLTKDTTYDLKVTRDSAGQFELFVDDVSVVAATGTNPVTDNTYTKSEYWTFELKKEDGIHLYDEDGVALNSRTPLL
jgi:hypothetical protein